MLCNCGNCCNNCNCCNKPCNGCSSDYINGLNQEYLNLNTGYNENADEAMAANNALIEAMQNVVAIAKQQNCIVQDIEECVDILSDIIAKSINIAFGVH